MKGRIAAPSVFAMSLKNSTTIKQVFISYAREDCAMARRLYADLQKAGVKPWLVVQRKIFCTFPEQRCVTQRQVKVMRTLAIEYSETIPAMSNMSTELFEEEARLAMAMKLYEIGRLTSGQAAAVAGVSRVTFLLSCQRFQTWSVIWDHAEFDAERQELSQ